MDDFTSLRKLISEIEEGTWSPDPELLETAKRIEERIRLNPVSDEDAIKAGAEFICNCPIGDD